LGRVLTFKLTYIDYPTNPKCSNNEMKRNTKTLKQKTHMQQSLHKSWNIHTLVQKHLTFHSEKTTMFIAYLIHHEEDDSNPIVLLRSSIIIKIKTNS
jgi:hypothetical protein